MVFIYQRHTIITWLWSIIIETIHYRTEMWPSSSTIISQLLRIKRTLIAGIHLWIRTLNAGIFRFKITTLFAGICQRKRTLNAGTRGFLGSKLWPFSRVFLFAHCIKGLIRSSTPGQQVKAKLVTSKQFTPGLVTANSLFLKVQIPSIVLKIIFKRSGYQLCEKFQYSSCAQFTQLPHWPHLFF